MIALAHFFFRLCLLRARPQDFPSSRELLGLTALGAVAVGASLVGGVRASWFLAVVESAADVGLALAVLWLGLRWTGHRARFIQAATAVMAMNLVLGALTVPLLAMSVAAGDAGELAVAAGLLLLAMLGWNIVVLGHILRHTFDVSMSFGVGMALLYTVFSYNVITGLFPTS